MNNQDISPKASLYASVNVGVNVGVNDVVRDAINSNACVITNRATKTIEKQRVNCY